MKASPIRTEGSSRAITSRAAASSKAGTFAWVRVGGRARARASVRAVPPPRVRVRVRVRASPGPSWHLILQLLQAGAVGGRQQVGADRGALAELDEGGAELGEQRGQLLRTPRRVARHELRPLQVIARDGRAEARRLPPDLERTRRHDGRAGAVVAPRGLWVVGELRVRPLRHLEEAGARERGHRQAHRHEQQQVRV